MKRFLLLFLSSLLCLTPVFASEKIDINTASQERLTEITGIGPVLSQRIAEKRPFSSIDDLMKVKGIGEITLQKIKEEGLAYIRLQKPKEENIPPPEAPITYPDGIVFDEIMPSPEGPDKEEEWIKLYNENNFEVNLTNWQVLDKMGDIKSYAIPKGKIPQKGFFVLQRTETGITLNNSGDTLELKNPAGKVVDSVSYEKAPTGESFKRTGAEWVWSGDIVQGEKEKPKSVPVKSSLKDSIESSNDLSILFTASFLALFCAILILILKISLNKKEPL